MGIITTPLRNKKLALLADWCVLRQQLIERRTTVILWCEVNWPEANADDINFLFNNISNMLTVEA